MTVYLFFVHKKNPEVLDSTKRIIIYSFNSIKRIVVEKSSPSFHKQTKMTYV